MYFSKRYIEKVLQSFSCDQSKVVAAPLETDFKLGPDAIPTTSEERKYMSWVHTLVLLDD